MKSRSRERNDLPEVILPGLDLETQNAWTLFSLRPRPLHLEGLEPQPSPPSHRHHWPGLVAGGFSESHLLCCLEARFSKAHPVPCQEDVFTLWEGVSHQEVGPPKV